MCFDLLHCIIIIGLQCCLGHERDQVHYINYSESLTIVLLGEQIKN